MIQVRAPRRVVTALALALSAPLAPGVAQAQAGASPSLDIRREIESLRAEQRKAAERIAALEAALDATAQTSSPQAAPAPAAAPLAPSPPASPSLSRLQVSGDVRLRYENNFGGDDVRDRERGVLRARLRGAFAANDWLTLGAQVTTGDPDDPNSTDVTLGNFADDLQVSLDQAYLRGVFGGVVVYGGKIPLPFARTDLVWDGDVSPQGVSVAWTAPLAGGSSLKASGLYFLIDESAGGPDSRMIGGQLAFETKPSASLKLELAAGYYDYALRSLAGGDAGDFRSNRFANGRYLSDFNLFDAIGTITWSGVGEAWPIRLTGDYVRNSGAVNGAESGFEIDLSAGRSAQVGDWRWTYGYAQADTDAVLTAFSHDNTNLASNYVQHTVALDYVASRNVILNATLYHYRPKDAALAPPGAGRDWLERLRLNLLVNF